MSLDVLGGEYIYSKVKFGITPEINAISTIVVAGTALAILAAWRLGAFRSQVRTAVADQDGAPW